jgi:hypothetical protein
LRIRPGRQPSRSLAKAALALLDWLVPTVTIQFEKIEGAKARRVMMRIGRIR